MKRALALLILGLAFSHSSPASAEVSEKRFFTAIGKRDWKKLARYLDKGVPEKLEERALRMAIDRHDLGFVQLMLRYTNPSETAMRLALSREQIPIIEALAEKGGRFDDKALFWDLIREKKEDLALAVLAAGKELHEPGPVSGLRVVTWKSEELEFEKYVEPRAMNALFLALDHGLERLADRLLELGSDANLRVVAAPGGVRGVNTEGLAEGERITVKKKGAKISYRRVTNALVESLRDERYADAAQLLDAGADVFPEGATRDLDACAQIIDKASIDRELRLRLCPWTEIHDAIRSEDMRALEAALASGLDVNRADYRDRTPLSLAIATDSVEIVERLLQAGADPNLVPGRFGRPALVTAASQNKTDLLGPLVAGGADIDGPVLHEAGNLATLRTLVELGANIHAIDSHGRNALVRFNEWGAFEMIDYLRQRGLSYPEEFGTSSSDLEIAKWTSHRGHPKELMLVDVAEGTLHLRGQLSDGKVSALSCRLDDLARDARYFYAPQLVKGRELPTPEPLVTLKDQEIERFEGLVVRAGVLDGRCTFLALPTAKKDEAATPKQLDAAMAKSEVRGDVFEMLTTGKVNAVYPGKLLSARKGVVLVEVDGGLKVRCKLQGRTRGIVYGAAGLIDQGVFGGREVETADMVSPDELGRHVGKRVKVGPGTGRCEYFEILEGP